MNNKERTNEDIIRQTRKEMLDEVCSVLKGYNVFFDFYGEWCTFKEYESEFRQHFEE